MIIQHRRGTTYEWLEFDIIPAEGELVIEECPDGTRKCKIGNGYSKFSKLPYTDDKTKSILLQEITQAKTEVKTELSAGLNTIAESLEETKSSMRVAISSEEAARKEAVAELRQNFSAAEELIQSNIKATEQSLTKSLSETTNSLTTKIDNVNIQLNSDVNSLKTDLEAQIDTLDETFRQTSEQLESNCKTSLESAVQTLQAEITEVDTRQTNELNILNESTRTAVNAINEQLIDINLNLTETIPAALTEIQESFETRLTDETQIRDSADSQLRQDLNALITDTEAKTSEISENLSKLSEHVENSFEKADAALSELDEQLTAEVESVKGALETHKTSLENELLQVKKDINASISSLEEEINQTITGLDDKFENKLEAHSESFNNKLLVLDQSVTSKINDLETTTTSLFENLEEQLGNQANTFTEQLTKTSTEITANLSNEFNTKLSDSTQELLGQINAAVDTQESNLSILQENVEQSITNLTEQITQILDLCGDLGRTDNTLAEAISAVEQQNKSSAAALATQIKVLEGNTRELSTFVNGVVDRLDISEEKLLANVEDLSMVLSEAVEKLETHLADAETNISQGLVEYIESVNKSLVENIETLRSTTNLKFIEIQSNIDDVAAEIQSLDTATTIKFAELQTEIANGQTNIEESLTELGDQIEEVNEHITITDQNVAEQTRRINNIIALPDGSTTADGELTDIRVGYNGVDYASAGDAVRAIGHELDDLRNSLPEYIPSNAVDGLYYENNQLWLTSKDELVGEPVTITGGGGGGSISTVKVKNNLASASFTVSKGSEAWIDFTYTSFENEVATGDGVYSIIINDKTIEVLSGSVIHGVAKQINVADYLRNGSNSVKITCSDQYGSSRSLVYTISVIELRIESSFNSAQIFNDTITFRYKVFGQVEKTAYIYLDGNVLSEKSLGASVSGNEITLLIPKQTHGCHKITAYVSTTLNENVVTSNILEYEIICIESDENRSIIASVYELTEVNQGDLISIPYMIYDPTKINTDIDLIVYSQVAGELIEIDRSTVTVNRELQYWNTRKYPIGLAIFTISYTYDLYGVITTVTKAHTVKVNALEVDVTPEEDSLQLYLTAQGRSNNEQNPAIWTFTQAPNGDKTYETITTAFSGFNWKSNGWVTDTEGDTCLRLNGDARAEINFKPFKDDFKSNGKTIEFEFIVRDVNDRDAIVIDCFDGSRGFRATPDTAFLKSSGSEVSCRYKDEERVRVAISVEHAETPSRFVSIYLDGVLSGVQRYATTDIFSQDNPLTISLGSSLCGLDIYNIRIYDKALSTPAILTNYIADQTVPATRLQLMTNNDILDEDGQVSYDRVKALGQIPIITFTGPMPKYKGDKKKKTTRMKFEDPVHPEMSFDVLLDQIDVQGTSSQFYIRKNWKVKLPESRAHMPGAIPAKVFCIKVDYAEATGTHNTGAANYVETLYDREEVTLPPQKDDTRVRTTIQGFPIIIFEKETEDSEPVFSSKGNFNYDKDAENAFGFTKDYKDYGVECWEFCNNTSDPVNFAGEIPAEWLDDFEPRYVPESANFERIEELQELAELAASGKGIITEAQKNELATLMRNCISNFKEMHDWVLSTATYTLVDGKRVPIVPVPLAEPITYGETTYTEDNEEYRLAKFKYEFKNYFNMHYTSMYYVFTFFALMTDQRAKNLFLTRWKDEDGVYRWYPYFYDNDTIFGINNEGALVFDYFHEDTDQLGSSNVYNGQNSVFWHNFRLCFPQEISSTYSTIRSSGKLTYSKIIDQFVTNGSDKWSEAIYNADADYKYVSMARESIEHTDEEGNVVSGLDASNLYQVRGKGEQHLRYFVANRINYCDSKWYAGSYPSDDIFLRIYTPKPADDATQEEINRINASLAAVPANPSITITPFSDMYAGVRYKSGTLQQQRLKAGEAYTFSPLNANETFGDTETAIYGAGEISSLGNLSGLYCGVINLSNARKLTELTVGSANPAYYNDNFREISVGNNRLLRYIDLRNCSGLGIAGENPQKTLELSGCPNIEHIYAEGTNLSSIDLPDSGYVKTLHLPKSINTLVIQNQKNITDFVIEANDYSNIRTLRIENSNLDTNAILEACRDENGKYTVARVRLTDISWGTAEAPLANADFVKSLFPIYDDKGNIISGIRGIDEKNNPLDDAYLVGTCYIAELTGEDYTEIKSHYPYLDIKFGKMTSNVTFKYSDTSGTEYTHTISINSVNSELGTCPTPELSPLPAWPENAAFTYEFAGWSRKQQTSKGIEDHEDDYKTFIQADALLNIAGDRILYPVFKAIRKSYKVTFVNNTAPEGDKVLAEIDTPYGSDADYLAAGYPTPTKLDVTTSSLYAFTGWHPKPEAITGTLTCYAQFTLLDSVWYTIGISDITDCVDHNGNIFDGYTLNKTNNTMAITECNNNLNPAVKVPNSMTFDEGTFTVVSLGGFSGHDKLELISLPSTLIEVAARAFEGCRILDEITLPESLQIIGQNAFMSCTKIKAVSIPSGVHTINDAAFAACTKIAGFDIEEGNDYFIFTQGCLINKTKNHLIQGLANSEIPQDGSVQSLGHYCYHYMPITSVTIPEGITAVSNNAFSHCEVLQEVTLPSTLLSLDATCFAWCYQLSKIDLPDGLLSIRTYVFNQCALETVIIPASVNEIMAMAFSMISTLKTVTFKKALNADGSIKMPAIEQTAFSGSGSLEHPIVFNFPWSEEEHYDKYAGLDKDLQEKDPTFGAAYYIFNFNYEEETN